MAKKRVYKKGAPGSEYDAFHGKPEQVANRAARNKARSEAVKEGRVKKGDSSKHLDHVIPLSKGGSKSTSNTRVVSATANRKKADKMPSKKGKK